MPIFLCLVIKAQSLRLFFSDGLSLRKNQYFSIKDDQPWFFAVCSCKMAKSKRSFSPLISKLFEIIYIYQFYCKMQGTSLERIESSDPNLSKNQGSQVAILQKAVDPQQANPETPKERLKSTTQMILIGFIISLSALMHGYSIKEITSVPIKTILSEYSITMDSFSTQSILIGVIPLGSVVGAIITHFILKKYRRLSSLYIFTFFSVLAIILVNITTFATLVIGRTIQGICIGYYTAIAPLYLREIAPKELRRVLGLLFSVGKSLGVLIAIILELSFDSVGGVYLGWRAIISITAGFALLQAVLVFFFCPPTPYELIEKGEIEEARQIIIKLYRPQFVEQVLQEYKKEYEMEIAKDKETPSEAEQRVKDAKDKRIVDMAASAHVINEDAVIVQVEDEVPERTYEEKKRSAFILSCHLCLVRHWMGGNAIISQGGYFVGTFDVTLGKYTTVIVSCIQFAFIIVGLVYIVKKFGKRPLFLFCIPILSTLNIIVAICMIYKNAIACETILCIYMVIYGATYIAPIWAYPSEIIPASQALIPNIINWISLATSTLIPPLVLKAMPDNNPYPVFFFFGGYGLLCLLHVVPTMRESDGHNYNEIIKSFK